MKTFIGVLVGLISVLFWPIAVVVVAYQSAHAYISEKVVEFVNE